MCWRHHVRIFNKYPVELSPKPRAPRGSRKRRDHLPLTKQDIDLLLFFAKQAGQKLNVLVKGDQGVAYGKVVVAMGLLKKAGAEQVGLLTDSDQTNFEGRA